jgi:hypothetical protein
MHGMLNTNQLSGMATFQATSYNNRMQYGRYQVFSHINNTGMALLISGR